MSDVISQDVVFAAAPERIHKALTDASEFGRITGAPAEIEAREGGAFSCFGGAIVGRNVELAPQRRVVQAWRVAGWPEGVFSLVRFELEPNGLGTRLTLHHSSFPQGADGHLAAGWEANYWNAIRKLG